MKPVRKKVPGEKPYASNKAAIAKVIERHFAKTNPEFKCPRIYIDRWLALQDNPFPKADDAGRYNVAECLEWVTSNKKELVNAEKDELSEVFARAKVADAKRKIQRQEYEKWEQETERGLWIKKSEHNSILSGLGTQTWDTVCENVERGLIEKLEHQLQPLEIPTELKSAIVADAKIYHTACIDEMQRQFAASVEAEKKA